MDLEELKRLAQSKDVEALKKFDLTKLSLYSVGRTELKGPSALPDTQIKIVNDHWSAMQWYVKVLTLIVPLSQVDVQFFQGSVGVYGMLKERMANLREMAALWPNRVRDTDFPVSEEDQNGMQEQIQAFNEELFGTKSVSLPPKSNKDELKSLVDNDEDGVGNTKPTGKSPKKGRIRSSSNTGSLTTMAGQRDYDPRLIKLIGKYSGDPLRFIEYKQLFDEIVGDRDYPDSVKLQVLRNTLDAETAHQIRYCNTYEAAMDRVLAKFDDPRDMELRFERLAQNLPKLHSVADIDTFGTLVDEIKLLAEMVETCRNGRDEKLLVNVRRKLNGLAS